MKHLLSLLLVLTLAGPALADRATLGVTTVKTTPALLTATRDKGQLNTIQRVTQSLDGQLINALNQTRKFEVVGRSDQDVIQQELAFKNSGNLDPEDKNVRLFKQSGARYLLTVAVDDFQDYTKTATFGGIGKSATKRLIRLGAVGKIYETSTGKLLESASLQIANKDIEELMPNAIENGRLSDELLRKIAEKMSVKIANRVIDVVYPAKVIAKGPDGIKINRGQGTGIEAGQTWNVYALGEEMIDPDTGESLGADETLIGKVRIDRVEPKFSAAKILEDNGIAKLQIVRPSQ